MTVGGRSMTALVVAPDDHTPTSVRHTVEATCPACGGPIQSTPLPDPTNVVRRCLITCPTHGTWRLTVTLTRPRKEQQ